MQFDFLAKRAVLFGLMVMGLLSGGCVRTMNPILKDDQVISNDALIGKWVAKDGKVTGDLRAGDDNKYKLTYSNEQGKVSNLLVRFGKIGDVSVAEISPDSPPIPANTGEEYTSLLAPMYTLVVIDSTQPQLQLTAISTDWLKKYVQAHPDDLSVNNPNDLIVQASTQDFQRFFLKHYKDDGMLGEPAIFVHPGDPTTQPAK